MKTINNDFLVVKDFAERLCISISKAYMIINSGEIRTYRLGKQIRINNSDYEMWLQDHAPQTADNKGAHHDKGK